MYIYHTLKWNEHENTYLWVATHNPFDYIYDQLGEKRIQ